jgi:glycosyltransferase involved in cell wall biosynthesis
MRSALPPSGAPITDGTQGGASGNRPVLVVSFDFPPSLEVGAHACSQLASYLPDYGWEPVVLTVYERYLTNPDPKSRRPFPGDIIRTGMLPHPLDIWSRLRSGGTRTAAAGASAPAATPGRGRRWLLSLLKTPDVCTGWLPVAVLRGIREVRRRNIRHILSSAPHWTNHLVALCIAAVTRRPWTAHFRDPWIGIPQWKPVSRLSMAIEERLERLVVLRATNVVCVTAQHTALLRQRYPSLPAEKLVTVPNGFDEGEWDHLPPSRTPRDNGRTFVVTYAGSFYQARNPRPLFEALRRLIDAGEIDKQAVRIDLVGWCDVAEGTLVREAARRAGLESTVHFAGALSRDETLPRLLKSDLLLLLAEAQPYQIPGKTYEYLRAGRPILALTGPGAVAQFLGGVPGAHVVLPDDIGAIATAVREVYGHWRQGSTGPVSGSDFVRQFDRRQLAGRLAEVLARDSSVASLPGRSPVAPS